MDLILMKKCKPSNRKKQMTFVAPGPRLKQEHVFSHNKPYIKYLVIIGKSGFYKVAELTDMIVTTVTGKAIQHVSSLMAELGFLALSSCNFPGNEN